MQHQAIDFGCLAGEGVAWWRLLSRTPTKQLPGRVQATTSSDKIDPGLHPNMNTASDLPDSVLSRLPAMRTHPSQDVNTKGNEKLVRSTMLRATPIPALVSF